jgi:hypothetical protein
MSNPPASPGRRPASAVAELGVILSVITAFVGAALVWVNRPAAIEPAGSIIATAEHAEIYGLLARGFLRGQLSLDVEPPPELIQAANPYDPAQRPKVPYPHDASLYHGRFYAYFGPAPALLAYTPWRALTGRDLPTPWAVLGFATLAFLALVSLFRAVADEAYPDAPSSLRLAAILALGSTSMLLPLVRRPAVYEAAIAAGAAAMLWALYAAWRGRHPARQIQGGLWCGLLLGVAIASRPTFGLAALPAWMILSGTAEGRNVTLRWHRGVTAAVIGGGAVVSLLLIYNYARFGSPFEFGQKYQLASLNENTVQHFGLRFLRTQAWLYLLSPLQWSAFFPFVAVMPLTARPEGFGMHELSFGLLTNLPFLGLAAWTYAQAGRQRTRNPIAAPLLIGLVAALGPMLLYYYSTIRYQTEFAVWIALAAALGALEFGRGRYQRALIWVLSLAASGVVALVCVQAYEPDPYRLSRFIEPLARIMNKPARAWRDIHGLAPGPVVFDLAPGQPAPTTDRFLLRVEGPANEAESLLIGPSTNGGTRLIVRREGSARGEASVELPTLPPESAGSLVVSLSSLYPHNESEMEGNLTPAAFRSLKHWVRIDYHGLHLMALAVPPLEWQTERVLARTEDLAGAGWPAYARIKAVHRAPPTPVLAPAEPWGGVRITWRPLGGEAGQSLPLGATGQAGEANFLFLRTEPNHTIRFGYDHWGKPLVLSPPITLDAEPEQTIEFWMPSLVSDRLATPLVVYVNGKRVWSIRVPFFPATAPERFILRNPIGGSSCTTVFPNGQITARGLPHPAPDTP